MDYIINASSIAKKDGLIQVKDSNIDFGTTKATSDALPNPAELFLGAFSACMLKNVERFSEMMKFSYSKAVVEVKATRLEKPPRMDNIVYSLTIFTEDEDINIGLLKKNIEKYGTIYNTVNLCSTISGTIKTANNV